MYYLLLPIISTTVELNNVVRLLTANEKETKGSIIDHSYGWPQYTAGQNNC
jgi:hypothetical protein